MPVNSTHADYDDNLTSWQRIRDVLAGDAAVKAGGEKYVARLGSQTDAEFAAYVERGFFFNATSRTVQGYLGMMFRRDPVLTLGAKAAGIQPVLDAFANDVDLVGTTLDSYAKNIVIDAVTVGRSGTLIDWQDEPENRAYLSKYDAESILNWRTARIDGLMKVTLVVLSETVAGSERVDDPFVLESVAQIRVLKLVPSSADEPGRSGYFYAVEIWQFLEGSGPKKEKEWRQVRTVVPTRLGRPLTEIPFVFHGPDHAKPDVAKSPIEDLVAANLDHYRLNTDYKHGMHFTALPTAFVTGFDKTAELRIGSTTAWVTETLGATAGYLEFKGDGLMTFERALDRVERLLTVLGSRLLESNKRVSESAEAIAIRQGGESSIIAGIALSVTASLHSVLRWVAWWHSTEEKPGDLGSDYLNYQLNADFDAAMLGATGLQALVSAWQSGAISRDTLLHNLRLGEILPPARTNEQELELIKKDPIPSNIAPMLQPSGQ